MPVCRQQFLDPNGTPYSLGTLEFYLGGSTTPAAIYATAAGTSLGTSATLDAGGYAPALYVAPGAYKVILKDSAGVTVWTQDGVEDVATTYFTSLGVNLSTGTTDVTSGYTVLATDALITVASTGGANPCVIYLPTATGHGLPLCIKNLGTVALAITAYSGETLETLDEVYSVPGAAEPNYPTIWLMADGVSNWFIIASHGL
jgi:hypothetical protein